MVNDDENVKRLYGELYIVPSATQPNCSQHWGPWPMIHTAMRPHLLQYHKAEAVRPLP